VEEIPKVESGIPEVDLEDVDLMENICPDAFQDEGEMTPEIDEWVLVDVDKKNSVLTPKREAPNTARISPITRRQDKMAPRAATPPKPPRLPFTPAKNPVTPAAWCNKPGMSYAEKLKANMRASNALVVRSEERAQLQQQQQGGPLPSNSRPSSRRNSRGPRVPPLSDDSIYGGEFQAGLPIQCKMYPIEKECDQIQTSSL
jgi:hypothetical protein